MKNTINLNNTTHTPVIQAITGVFVLWSYDLVAGWDSIIRNLGIDTGDLSLSLIHICIRQGTCFAHNYYNTLSKLKVTQQTDACLLYTSIVRDYCRSAVVRQQTVAKKLIFSFYLSSNPQLSSSASFLRLNVLSSLN